MAKDQLGHGSDTRGTGTQGMRLAKTHVLGTNTAKVYKNPEWEENVVKYFRNGAYQSKADSFHSDLSDAHGTAQAQLQRWADQDAKSRPLSNEAAASQLSSGAKTEPVAIHDSMQKPGYNEFGSRHGYNPDAVNSAIAAQNRSGRGKIGGREASAIHRLLKGR
jgi:hypothetical protein